MIGGAGADKFFLYDSSTQRSFYSNFGNADYADITDFTAEDRIVLGSTESYTFSAHGAHTNIFIGGDLIAIVRNASTELVQSRLQYVGSVPA